MRMPRQIKGFVFVERARDAYDEMIAEKIYSSMYAEKDVKVLRMVNQYGRPYTDFYLRRGAKPVNKLVTRFGSAMTFETPKGKRFGDRILIRKGKKGR